MSFLKLLIVCVAVLATMIIARQLLFVSPVSNTPCQSDNCFKYSIISSDNLTYSGSCNSQMYNDYKNLKMIRY